MNSKIIFLATLLLSLAFSESHSQLKIVSGPEKGTYEQFVNDIIKYVGNPSDISISNNNSGGSAENFELLVGPDSSIKLALIQEDFYHKMQAEDRLNNKNLTESIELVMPLASEEIHLVVTGSSEYNKLQDIATKRVAIGDKDQGSFSTAQFINKKAELDCYIYYTSFESILKSLSKDNIDAAFVIGSAPISMLDVDPMIMTEGIKLLEINNFNNWADYYEVDTIYKEDYEWLKKDIPTYSVRTLLVANKSKMTKKDLKLVNTLKSEIIRKLKILKTEGHTKWSTVIIPDDDSSFTSTKPTKSKSNKNKVVTYKVQIFSRNYNNPDKKAIINEVSYNTNAYMYLDAYRYTVGEFTSLQEAIKLQNLAREAGYNQAFIAAFIDNVRTTDTAAFR